MCFIWYPLSGAPRPVNAQGSLTCNLFIGCPTHPTDSCRWIIIFKLDLHYHIDSSTQHPTDSCRPMLMFKLVIHYHIEMHGTTALSTPPLPRLHATVPILTWVHLGIQANNKSVLSGKIQFYYHLLGERATHCATPDSNKIKGDGKRGKRMPKKWHCTVGNTELSYSKSLDSG